MSYSAPPPIARMFRMLAGSSLKYENQESTATSRPIRPDGDELADRDPRRVEAVHERLHQQHARVAAGGDASRSASAAVMRQRLLAQDVLAGPGGGDRPLGVEVVRQRDVDGVDVRVGEQRLVRAVGARDPQGRGGVAGRGRPSRDAIATTSHRVRALDARDDLAGRDAGRGQDPPANASPSPPCSSSRSMPATSRRLHAVASSRVPIPPARASALDTRRPACVRVWHKFAREEHKPCGSADASSSASAARRSGGANLSAIVREPARARSAVPLRARRRDRAHAQRDPRPGRRAGRRRPRRRGARRPPRDARAGPRRSSASIPTGPSCWPLEILVDSLAVAIVGLGGAGPRPARRVDRARGHLSVDEVVGRPRRGSPRPMRRRTPARRWSGSGVAVAGVVRRDRRPRRDGPEPRLDRRAARARCSRRSLGLDGPGLGRQRRRPRRARRAPPRRGDRRRRRAVRLRRGRRRRRHHRRRAAPRPASAGYGGEIGHLPRQPGRRRPAAAARSAAGRPRSARAPCSRLAGLPPDAGRPGRRRRCCATPPAARPTPSAALEHVGPLAGHRPGRPRQRPQPAGRGRARRPARPDPSRPCCRSSRPSSTAARCRPRVRSSASSRRALGVDAPLLGAAELAFEPLLADPGRVLSAGRHPASPRERLRWRPRRRSRRPGRIDRPAARKGSA